MSKKSFIKGIDAFFGEETKPMPKEKIKEIEKVEKRATFILDIDLLEKLKALAYWERKTAKALIQHSLESFFSSKGDEYVEKAVEQYRLDKPKEYE